MPMKTRLAALISIVSGAFTVLNSWSFFQLPSFYFTIACHLLAFGSLTIFAAVFLLLNEKHKTCWGALIIASSTLAFLSFGFSKYVDLLMPALIAFHLGIIGGTLSLTGGG